ncbi:hypothetical protein [Herbaspirillum frisingense]|uniref:hypothetical protein n=1 Tax=Herbaspirillum frisingense TaxID=92645 RepID=UPI0039AFF503
MERPQRAKEKESRISVEDLYSSVQGLRRSLDARHVENVQHMDANTAQLREIKEQLDELREGFPAGDPGGHRRYHEELIRAAEERRKFWQDWRSHMMRTGSWAALAFLLYQFKDYLRWIFSNINKG